MDQNEFLTIQEFIQKYDVADIRIRRRIRKYRLVDPQKLEGNLSERYDKGVGNIILLKEDFWVKELEATTQETAYAVPPKRSEETDQNRLSGTPEPLKRSDEIEPNRRSAEPTAYAPGQITVDQELMYDFIDQHFRVEECITAALERISQAGRNEDRMLLTDIWRDTDEICRLDEAYAKYLEKA